MAQIYTTITVDWDGTQLDDRNIAIMKEFNGSGIPLTHFICPAYLTRLHTKAEKNAMVDKINSVIKDDDEVGLHIHCWYSLMKASITGEVYSTPTYYKDNGTGPCIPTPGAPWGDQDCGHGVPLGFYPIYQIKQTLIQAKQLLIDAGIKNTTNETAFLSFRCGGWLACDHVLSAVRQTGFLYEASAVPWRYLSEVVQPREEAPVFGRAASIWSGKLQRFPGYLANTLGVLVYPSPGGVTALQPASDTTRIANPVKMSKDGPIQIPDTGVLADYTPRNVLTTYIDAALKQKNETNKDTFISMGWHLESAASYEPNYHPDLQNVAVVLRALEDRWEPLSQSYCTVAVAGMLWEQSQLSTRDHSTQASNPLFPDRENTQHEKPYN